MVSLSKYMAEVEEGLGKDLTARDMEMVAKLYEANKSVQDAVTIMSAKAKPSGSQTRVFESVGNTVVEITGLEAEE